VLCAYTLLLLSIKHSDFVYFVVLSIYLSKEYIIRGSIHVNLVAFTCDC
jgi:hypothetical protein